MIVRNLLDRLGLDADSPQLRIIGTSASLSRGRRRPAYLEQFFGVDRVSFDIIPGSSASHPGPRCLSRRGGRRTCSSRPGAKAGRAPAGERRSRSLSRPPAWLPPGAPARHALPAIAAQLFGEPCTDLAGDGEASSRAIARPAPDDASIPLRAHMFARTLRGMWACSDPSARCVRTRSRRSRLVGRLYDTPRSSCECGARVLELLYCFECGDVSLGGYVADRPGRTSGCWRRRRLRSPSTEAQPVFKRDLERYCWYRPGP